MDADILLWYHENLLEAVNPSLWDDQGAARHPGVVNRGSVGGTLVEDSRQPLGPMEMVLQAPDVHTSKEDYILFVYARVTAHGLPNFCGARLPLTHDLKIDGWRRYEHVLSDPTVVDFLEFGFPASYAPSKPPSPKWSNHQSALQFGEHVDKYLRTELEMGAIAGPFNTPLFSEFTTSPLMTRPKRNSTKRRVIMDLSFGEDDSVNGGIVKTHYLGNQFKLRLPSALDLRDYIVAQGAGCLLWSLDLERGYRQLRSCPADWPLLQIAWRGRLYQDLAVLFGLRFGAKAMQSTTGVRVMPV